MSSRGLRVWLARNAYLGLVLGGLLVAARAVTFTPPDQVRALERGVAEVVGEAPRQEFSHRTSNPQAVQIRASLRLYPSAEQQISRADPAAEDQGRMLSQPIVTTLIGMNATIEQTVRLDDARLEIDLTIHATPRLGSKPTDPLTLETEVTVHSSRRAWWTGRHQRRTHLDTRAWLAHVERHGHRTLFAVDDHLFGLDLEVQRPGRPAGGATLANRP